MKTGLFLGLFCGKRGFSLGSRLIINVGKKTMQLGIGDGKIITGGMEGMQKENLGMNASVKNSLKGSGFLIGVQY